MMRVLLLLLGLLAVAPDRGRIGRQLHQGAQGMTRPVDGVVFEQFRRGEEKGDGRCLGVLSDGCRAEDGDRDQRRKVLAVDQLRVCALHRHAAVPVGSVGH